MNMGYSANSRKRPARWATVLIGCTAAVMAVAVGSWHAPLARAESPAVSGSAVSLAQEAKDQAISALLRGQFDQGSRILSDAAGRTDDPTLASLARWAEQFGQQYAKALNERKEAYDKAVAQVQLLVKHDKKDHALDAATRAYSLAIDKAAFGREQWVVSLVSDADALAQGYEQQGQWQRAARVYLDLSIVEPAKPLWKNKLKAAGRFLRVQAMYTPEYLRKVQKLKTSDDEEVDALLTAANLQTTTRATSRPTTQNSDDDAAEAKVDWRDLVKGIEYEMLWTAIEDTRDNYYRTAAYPTLVSGGLTGLRAFVTTPGIETAFPSLGDTAKRTAFVRAIDEGLAKAWAADPDIAGTFREAVGQVRAANRMTVELPESVFVNEFMDGALGELDPFSSMIWPAATEEFNSSTQGEFSGVGIQIERDESGTLKVVSPLEDSPAYRAGIKAGDTISHVDGQLVKGILLDQVVKKIKGPTGTKVTLTVRSPDGGIKDYVLRRDTIKVASIKGWKRLPGGGWDYMVDPVQQVAYVRLSQFTRASADELERALKQLKKDGARGIIFDLRSDPGGLLSSAVDIADKFLAKGVIVSTRADRETPQQPTVNSATQGRQECDLPMVVLVNQFSASASEILSGALKDHGRALIVGERSFGKGSVQMLFPVAGRSAYLKLTTSHYYLPSGRCLHREENSTQWGVDPDVLVEMTPEQMRAVIDARQEMDVLRDPNAATLAPADAGSRQPARTVDQNGQAIMPAAKKPVDLLSTDPQLSAAVLLMRLELGGARVAPAPASVQASGVVAQ